MSKRLKINAKIIVGYQDGEHRILHDGCIVIQGNEIEGNFVRVEVRDNGLGIGEEYRQDIFAMFRRLHSRRQAVQAASKLVRNI